LYFQQQEDKILQIYKVGMKQKLW